MTIKYDIKKTLGGSLWKWHDSVEKVFTVLGPIRAGKAVASPRSGIAKAPDVMTVRDAEDNNEKDILVGAVLRSSLTENYPDDSYVGLTFACTQGPVRAGTRYKTMSVAEVEVDNADLVIAPAPKKAKK
jgi:hypothetical protein